MYLASRIVGLMPPRCKNPNKPDPKDKGWLHYVEPFAGGLSVLLANDPEGISEVVNDKHELLTNFWNALAIEERFKRLQRDLECTPFSKGKFVEAMEILAEHEKDSLLHRNDGCWSRDLATWAFFVACRQSMSGRMDSFAPLTRNRTRRGMNEQASAWLNCIEGLPAVHERLKRVVILNDDAIKVIRQQDGERTLFYIDAPYVHESRSTTGEYQHEMTNEQHEELIQVLLGIKGCAMVSMYRHPIYDVLHEKHGWRLETFDLPNNSATGKQKQRRIECLWLNY